MKYIIRLFITLFVVQIFLSCTHDIDNLVQLDNKNTNKQELTLEEKLTNIMKNGGNILTRSLMFSSSNFQLVEYLNIGKINSKKEIEQLKEYILSDESCFPYYDLDNERILLKKWKNIVNEKQYEDVRYSMDELSDYLNQKLEIGLDLIELIWKCESNYYRTICIASGNDILYDNIIVNTLCIIERSLNDSNCNLLKTNPVKTRSESSSIIKHTKSWGGDAYWLYGAERGSATIYHSVYGSGSSLYNSDCSASANMTLGSADAKAQITKQLLGKNGYSNCNYAYYIASPFVSFTIIGGNGINFRLSMSGIGSSASDTGDDLFYWPDRQ